jgi:hypothetical protein
VEVHVSTESKLKAVGSHSLFGPPPVIEEEDVAAYDELFGRVCAAIKPVDVIEEMLVADLVALEWDVLRGRRWKSNRIRECGLEALEGLLREELDYKHYRQRFADDLCEILQERVGLRDDQARSLATSCALNESDAIDKVDEVLVGIGPNRNHILRCAKEFKARELTQKYRRREPATVKFIDKLFAAAGKSFDSLLAKALPQELENIERIDRLITIAENRRDASLREIDRRRDLGKKVRKSLQKLEDNQFEVIEAAPAIQPKEADSN